MGTICLSFLVWLYLRNKEVQKQSNEALTTQLPKSELPIAKPQPLIDRLVSIKALWDKGESIAFYTSLSHLLQESIFEKLGLPIEEQDKTTVVKRLKNRISAPEADALYEYIRSVIERALYGGALNQDGPDLLAKSKQFLELLISTSKDTQTK